MLNFKTFLAMHSFTIFATHCPFLFNTKYSFALWIFTSFQSQVVLEISKLGVFVDFGFSLWVNILVDGHGRVKGFIAALLETFSLRIVAYFCLNVLQAAIFTELMLTIGQVIKLVDLLQTNTADIFTISQTTIHLTHKNNLFIILISRSALQNQQMRNKEESVIEEQDSLLENEDFHLFINSNSKMLRRSQSVSSVIVKKFQEIDLRVPIAASKPIVREPIVKKRLLKPNQKIYSNISFSKMMASSLVKNTSNRAFEANKMRSLTAQKTFRMSTSYNSRVNQLNPQTTNRLLWSKKMLMVKLNREMDLKRFQPCEKYEKEKVNIKGKRLSVKTMKSKIQLNLEKQFKIKYRFENPFKQSVLQSQYL